MTREECAIVMAYTGITMLSGEDFKIYHKYIEDIMGRPVWTHELANESVVEEIKKKSKYDFLKLCEKAKLSVSEDSDISREALLRKLEQIKANIFNACSDDYHIRLYYG